jgi:hypothetical protein
MLGLGISKSAQGVKSGIVKLLSSLKRRAEYFENKNDSKSEIKVLKDYELLNKATILLTPTATSDARVHSVKTYTGDELVPSIITTENNNGGVINYISGNAYSSTSDGTSSSIIRPKFDFNTTNGKTYKLIITPTGTITGTVNFDFYDGSSYLFQDYDFTTTKEIYFTDNGGVFGAFNGQQTYSINSFTISVIDVSSDFDFDREYY